MERDSKDKVEYCCGVICVASAISIGTSALVVSDRHDIEAGVLIFLAQLLLFAASIFHLNYKLGHYGEANHKKSEE
mgnify:FL=1|jgi:hypothetical protein